MFIFLEDVVVHFGHIFQGGLRTGFDESDAQSLFLKRSSLVTSDSFLKITPGALNLWRALSKKRIYCFKSVLFLIMHSLVLNLPADAESKLKIECQTLIQNLSKFIRNLY